MQALLATLPAPYKGATRYVFTVTGVPAILRRLGTAAEIKYFDDVTSETYSLTLSQLGPASATADETSFTFTSRLDPPFVRLMITKWITQVVPDHPESVRWSLAKVSDQGSLGKV
jgi:hypothetical protein